MAARVMDVLRRHRLAAVWILLMVLTLISWRVGEEHSLDGKVATVIVLVVAFVKVRLVGLHFMELRDAPPALRWIFQGYCVVVCAALVGMYLAGG